MRYYMDLEIKCTVTGIGTFHDGTAEAGKRMDERFLARAAQKAAAESGGT